MTFQQLRIFQVIARLQNISAAAKELYISQPSVSSSLSQLESELGTELFDRNGKRLTLNNAGQQFLITANRILKLMDESVENLRHSENVEGHIRISGHIFSHTMTEDIAAFSQRYPNVQFHYNGASRFSGNFKDSPYDFVLLPDYECVNRPHISLDKRKQLYAVLPKGHPLANRESLQLIELKDEYFYFVSPRDGRMEFAFNYCLEAGFTPKVRYIVDNGFSFLDLFNTGTCVTLTYNTHDTFQHLDTVTMVPISDLGLSLGREVCLCMVPETPSPLAQSFYEFVAQRHLQDLKEE